MINSRKYAENIHYTVYGTLHTYTPLGYSAMRFIFAMEISNEKSCAFKVSNKFETWNVFCWASVGDASQPASQAKVISKPYGLLVKSASYRYTYAHALTTTHFAK